MKSMRSPYHNFLLLTVCVVIAVVGQARPRPTPNDGPVFARWLINQSSWGVVSTLDEKVFPFGNVVSVSDGGTGTPFFYLSINDDPTAGYARKDSRASFTVSEYALAVPLRGEHCQMVEDAQSPVCSKLTFTGRLDQLPGVSNEAAVAQAALFTYHPRFAGWPMGHNFAFFKLEIEKIFLVNNYSHYKILKVEDYYQANTG